MWIFLIIGTNVSILCFSNYLFWQFFRIANENFNCCRVSYWCCKFLALIYTLYRDSKTAKYLMHPTCLGKDKINNKPWQTRLLLLDVIQWLKWRGMGKAVSDKYSGKAFNRGQKIFLLAKQKLPTLSLEYVSVRGKA